jgi:hypothetical protein
LSLAWLALLVLLGLVTVLLWRGLLSKVERPAQVRAALLGAFGAGVLGGLFVGSVIYGLFTMDSGGPSPDALVRSGLVGAAAGAYIALVSADVYALLARLAGSSRAVVLVSILLGPIVAVAVYIALFTTIGPPTGR